MPKHLLKDLPIEGGSQILALEPGFDLYNASKVLELCVTFDDEGADSTLRLLLQYVGDSGEYEFQLVCRGIQQIRLPPLGPQEHLPELEIEDVSNRMLEGAKFEVASQFSRSFTCLCRSVAVGRFRVIDPDRG